MSCGCMGKDRGVDGLQTKRPTDRCVYCGEKHASTAYALAREGGYEGVNRQFIIGELVLAQWHLKNKPAAKLLREARHLTQERRESEIDWGTLVEAVDAEVSAQLARDKA